MNATARPSRIGLVLVAAAVALGALLLLQSPAGTPVETIIDTEAGEQIAEQLDESGQCARGSFIFPEAPHVWTFAESVRNVAVDVELTTWDGYTGRDTTDPQLVETVTAQAITHDGVATVARSIDIPDGVTEATETTSGSIETSELLGFIVSHDSETGPTDSVNYELCWSVEPVTRNTTTTTTTPPKTTTSTTATTTSTTNPPAGSIVPNE